MGFSLRYTSHTGYAAPDYQALFHHSVASDDLAAHVRFAADHGFTGVLHPHAVEHSAEAMTGFRHALDEAGLVCSTITPFRSEVTRSGLWTDPSVEARDAIRDLMHTACSVARLVDADSLAVVMLSPAPLPDGASFLELATPSLDLAAGVAAEHGVSIALEPISIVPISVLRDLPTTAALIEAVGRPNVGILYDTGHIAHMTDDLVASYREFADHVTLVQLADQPGRVEPGHGTLPLEDLAVELVRSGYTGLVDLEHGWSSPGLDGETSGLEHLLAFDRRVTDRAAATV